MIALLRGTLVEKHPNQVILDVGGVGYDVTVPISTFSKLPGAGSETRLRIHTHVREDALALYGFLTADEKNLFEKLIGVSNIGPGLAIKVLSGMEARDLLNAHTPVGTGQAGADSGRWQENSRAYCSSSCADNSCPAAEGDGQAPAEPALSALDEDGVLPL